MSDEIVLVVNGKPHTVQADFGAGIRENVAQLLAGKITLFEIEELHVQKKGRESWVRTSVSLVRDADSNPLRLIATCDDITLRKQAEMEVHQLNVQLEANQALLAEIAERKKAEEALQSMKRPPPKSQ